MQNVTRHTCTLQLVSALSLDDFSAKQTSMADALTTYLGQAVTLQLVAGSVIVNAITVINDTFALDAFWQQASNVSSAEELQLYFFTSASLDVQTEVIQVPVDVDW